LSAHRKILCIVIDGVGIGELPDAALYGDAGANTLCRTAERTGGLALPVMGKLGLGNIAAISGVPAVDRAEGCYGKMREVSKGKDSTTGHWELSGIVVTKDFPYYPKGFPDAIIKKFCTAVGIPGVLGNCVASGTHIIQEFGDQHVRSGQPIVYTSADSVFQIAAHEEIIPLERLYDMCRTAREEVLIGDDAVGRVIARPFLGSNGIYTRTPNRRDFSLVPPGITVFDLLYRDHVPTIAIGKIDDLFAGRSLSETHHTKSNEEGIEEIIRCAKEIPTGFVMANLVDFDMLYGHRQDPDGMKRALEYFDAQLPRILDAIGGDDILLITADHGNDPTDQSTDHTREYVPLLTYTKRGTRNADLGTRGSFADIGKTVGEFFGCDTAALSGESLLPTILPR
jgi:phosphopentomutase